MELMLAGMMHCSNCGLGNYQLLVPASHGDAAQRCPQTRQHLSPRCCGAVLIIVGDQQISIQRYLVPFGMHRHVSCVKHGFLCVLSFTFIVYTTYKDIYRTTWLLGAGCHHIATAESVPATSTAALQHCSMQTLPAERPWPLHRVIYTIIIQYTAAYIQLTPGNKTSNGNKISEQLDQDTRSMITECSHYNSIFFIYQLMYVLLDQRQFMHNFMDI